MVTPARTSAFASVTPPSLRKKSSCASLWPVEMLHLRRLAQAGFVLRSNGTSLVVDAFLSPRPDRLVPPDVAPETLVGMHAILATHEHRDHLDRAALPALAAASPGAMVVVPAPIADEVRALVPTARVVGARVDETIVAGDVRITPVPARHGVKMADAYTFGRELSGGLYRYLGYVLDDGVARIYHAGDTIVYEGQAERLRALGVDVALLPINGRDHFREAAGVVGNMDHREAARLAADAGVDVLVQIHYDTFPQNLGFPAHLVDVVRREHPSVAVLIPSRDRPVLYARARNGT